MHAMKNPTWPKALAFIGFAIFGLALAYYSTAIATAGVAAKILGSDRTGDWLTTGSAVLMVGLAAAAAFSFLALTSVRALTRRG
jgi:threonine/homoserine/homoserine lactone efflux protein